MFKPCEARPDLSGALFLLMEKLWQKKTGTEGGKRRPNNNLNLGILAFDSFAFFLVSSTFFCNKLFLFLLTEQS